MLRFWPRKSHSVDADKSLSAPERVLVLSDVIGATQFVNFTRPLAADVTAGRAALTLFSHAKLGKNVETSAAEIWAAAEPTVLILSRYSSGGERPFIRRARSSGVPIVYHLDDNLFAVPQSLGHGKFKHYNSLERLAALRAAIDASDILFASTDVLARELNTYGLRPPIVAGETACAMDPAELRDPQTCSRPVFGYMASASHGRDLNMVLPAIEQALTTQQSLTFELFGSLQLPESLLKFGNRVVHRPPVSGYKTFLDQLTAFGWWVGLAPLEDIGFNRCKTEIKWLEYTAAGIPCIASNMVVYRRCAANGEAYLASTADEWQTSLRMLLDHAARRNELLLRSRLTASADYSMQRLAAQLYRVIDQARVGSASSGSAPG